MKFILATALAVFSTCAIAAPWILENLGRHVQETNFALDGKCSSTMIDREAGLLLTAHHCVADKELGDMTMVKQKLYVDHENTGVFMVQAEYVAKDHLNDLALLKLSDGATAPFPMEATVATEAPIVGDTIWVVGNPLGLDNTVTRGIISAKHRKMERHEYWQTDAVIAGGASGGAVYNDDGELIGVVSAGIMAQMGFNRVPMGFNFVVPLDRVQTLLSNYRSSLEVAAE
jgi:serine protease Do